LHLVSRSIATDQPLIRLSSLPRVCVCVCVCARGCVCCEPDAHHRKFQGRCVYLSLACKLQGSPACIETEKREASHNFHTGMLVGDLGDYDVLLPGYRALSGM